MGYIYQIINKINNKRYIGQTVKPVEKRFAQHKNNYTKPYFSQLALYKAFNKYGIENFIFESIEEVDNEHLDEREKYWIKYYNSYYDGYNSTIGGRLVQLYDWDIDQIIDLYMQLRSARKVAAYLNCDHSTIDNILNSNKIPRFTTGEQRGTTVIIKKGDIEKTFSSIVDCAKFLIENNYTQSKKINSVRTGIAEAYKNKRKYYGFDIYYESKIQSII